MLGHRHTPVGVTPVATSASHSSATAAMVSNCAATNSPAREIDSLAGAVVQVRS